MLNSSVDIGLVILERKFLNFVNVFIFAILFLSPPWKRCHPSFEQSLFPFTKWYFVPSLVEIGWVVLEKMILNFVNVCTFYLPWKRPRPFIWTIFISLNPKCFMPSLVRIGSVVLEKKMKMWKVHRQTDGQQAIRKVHLCFSLGELK